MEYHAKGGGGSWHANRRTSGQLSFEGSWIKAAGFSDSGPPFRGSAIPGIRVRVNRNPNPNPSPNPDPGMADPRNGGPVPSTTTAGSWFQSLTVLTANEYV